MEWIAWAVGEGFFMGLMKFGQGFVGGQSPTLWHVILATGIVGMIQMTTGFGVVAAKKKEFHVNEKYLMGSLGLGLAMSGATFCAFAALRAGADMGANTFIGNALVIIPAAFIGRWSFRERVGARQWIGVALGLAGAVFVTVPALGAGGGYAWIAWSLGTLFCATLMRVIQKYLAKLGNAGLPPLHPGQMLFWGGVSMTLCMPLGFIGEGVLYAVSASPLLLFAAGVALCNSAWWWCRLRAFQEQAPLAIKDLPSMPVYLATASVAGTLWFGDAMGIMKIVGLLMFFPAFFLAQEDAWGYCAGFFTRCQYRKVWSAEKPSQRAPAKP